MPRSLFPPTLTKFTSLAPLVHLLSALASYHNLSPHPTSDQTSLDKAHGLHSPPYSRQRQASACHLASLTGRVYWLKPHLDSTSQLVFERCSISEFFYQTRFRVVITFECQLVLVNKWCDVCVECWWVLTSVGSDAGWGGGQHRSRATLAVPQE